MLNGIIKFFKQCWNEIHSVTWPTKKTAIHSVIVVCVAMTLVGLILALSDGIFSQGIEYIINLKS